MHTITTLTSVMLGLFLDRFAGEIDSEFAEDLLVHIAQHYGAVDLATLQQRETVHGLAAVLILGAEHREGHEDLVGVKPRVLAVEVVDLHLLNRCNHILGDELGAVVYPGEMLGRIEYQRCEIGRASCRERV